MQLRRATCPTSELREPRVARNGVQRIGGQQRPRLWARCLALWRRGRRRRSKERSCRWMSLLRCTMRWQGKAAVSVEGRRGLRKCSWSAPGWRATSMPQQTATAAMVTRMMRMTMTEIMRAVAARRERHHARSSSRKSEMSEEERRGRERGSGCGQYRVAASAQTHGPWTAAKALAQPRSHGAAGKIAADSARRSPTCMMCGFSLTRRASLSTPRSAR
mmetsp:Transcript_33363/g.79507  ORF Transcript_33363/g.79507 Transcript_33363/m.79507 type:complete len:218 (+) Transcript_33363:855-1508(+)